MSSKEDAEAVGAQIRALLFSLRAENHTEEQERSGRLSYATDHLRRIALDRAGFCWAAPGEMAPQCCCDWSPQHPEGPRTRSTLGQGHNRKVW